MSKKNKVPYNLNPCKNTIPDKEIYMIIRGADDIVLRGGRSLLSKLLKGSKDNKMLELQLDKNPSYGVFSYLSMEDIKSKIDWMIENHYFTITYDGKLPMLGYEKKGYHIAIEILSDEYLEEIKQAAQSKNNEFAHNLKDKNREMVFLLLDKLQQIADQEYLQFFEYWKTLDYKKVQAKIEMIIKKVKIS